MQCVFNKKSQNHWTSDVLKIQNPSDKTYTAKIQPSDFSYSAGVLKISMQSYHFPHFSFLEEKDPYHHNRSVKFVIEHLPPSESITPAFARDDSYYSLHQSQMPYDTQSVH